MARYFLPIVVAVLTAVEVGYCQVNLVVNGSFEERTGCTVLNNTYSFQYCSGWQPLHGSPDYFHRCVTNEIWYGVPSNMTGFQETADPNDSAYTGVSTYTPLFAGGQESMRGSLSTPLIAGMKYRVRMKASIGTRASYTSCCIGIAFTPPHHPPYTANLTDVELFIPQTDIDTAIWYQLDGIYTAQGGEDRIYIGNFRPDADSHPFVMGDTTIIQNKYAYFYIDDVEMYEDDTITDTEMVEAVRIRAWHHDGQIMLRGMPAGAVAVLYDMAGRAVASGQGEMPAHGLSGLYVLRVMDAQGSVLHVQKLAVSN